MAREMKPDAITLDVHLPDFDGWRVLDRLKLDLATRHIPVQIITVEEDTEPALTQGALGYLVNGWQIAPIYQAQSGLPFSLVTSGSAPGGLSGGINGSGGRSGIAAVGRNTFRLPRTQVVDLRLSKKFTFTERYSAEVLGQAYNLFNHVNATGVNNTAYVIAANNTAACPKTADPTTGTLPCLNFNAPFGSITNANSNFAYSSRQVEIGFRFLF